MVVAACANGAGGRAAATASSARAYTDSTVWPVEGRPQPDLVAVEAGLALALLVAFFHRPSLPGHRDQHGQGDRPAGWGVAVEVRQLRRVGQAAADQHVVPRRAGRRPGPFVAAVALAARPARARLPAAGRYHAGQGRHGHPLPGRERDLEVDRDREHVPLPVLLARSFELRPQTSSPARKANGTPPPTAAVTISVPCPVLVANSTSSGTRARWRRAASAHHALGR
jgi:hypothetical protein